MPQEGSCVSETLCRTERGSCQDRVGPMAPRTLCSSVTESVRRASGGLVRVLRAYVGVTGVCGGALVRLVEAVLSRGRTPDANT